jgi:hypothetical protein
MGQGMHECGRICDGQCRNNLRSLRLRHYTPGYFLVAFQFRDLEVGHKRQTMIVSNKPIIVPHPIRERASGWRFHSILGHSIDGGFVLIH